MAEDGTSLVVGRSYRDAPEIDGLIWARGTARAGEFVDVRVERATAYDLWGALTSVAAVPAGVAA